MDIPDKAVEAAARAQHAWDVRNGTYHSDKYDNWDTLSASIRRDYCDAARLHLEAAAPVIAAKAWDEGASTATNYWMFKDVVVKVEDIRNPYKEEA